MMKIHIMGSLKFHIKIWKHTIFHLQIKFSFLTQSIKRACNVIQRNNLTGHLTTNLISIPFKIHSIDVTLCPYELGFLTIRTEVNTAPNMTLSEAIEFIARFRVLETKNDTNETICIECNGKSIPKLKNSFLVIYFMV